MRVKSAVSRPPSEVRRNLATYQWGAKKLCSPTYGVKARFTCGQTTVEVLFCFECDILAVHASDRMREENFDFNRNALLKIARQTFPRDDEIRALKPNENEEQDRKRFYDELARKRE